MESINLMTNAELNIQLKEMESEYEALKNKIKECVSRMDELDKKYIHTKNIMSKRMRGNF